MANAPFSPFQGEFDSLARQYWNTWNELLGRSAAPTGWSALAGSLPPGMARMDPGNFDWFSRIQQLAGQFGNGGSTNAADIARAWREMLGGDAAPFAGALHGMHGGLAGGAWLEQVRPLLDMLLRPLRQQQADWLQRPTFGPAREHQERLQALALVWQEWEQRNEEFNRLLTRAGQDAFERFERLLAEHDAPGKRLQSARALFDLWIDAAEEAWAGIAMSEEYRHAYGEMTNALMRLRMGLQREVEQFGTLLGLPGRAEVDALHRKVADLDRALHAARRGAAAPGRTSGQARAASPAAVAGEADEAAVAPVARARRKPASRKPVPRKSARVAVERVTAPVKQAARKPAAAKLAEAKPAVEKTAAKKTAAKKTARNTAPKKATPKAAAKKATAKKTNATTAKKAGAKKTTVASARKATARKPTATKAPMRKVTARRAPSTGTGRGASTPATASKAAPGGKRTAVPAAPAVAAAERDAAPARAGARQGQVVSMKDWVSRNLPPAPPRAGKRGGGSK